jgi:hypothetical protein
MMPFSPCKSNKLVEAIRQRDWATVIEVCESEPDDQHQHPHNAATQLASQRCRIKLSSSTTAMMLPLHYSVIMADGTDKCLHAVKAIVKVYPHALECKESSQHRTPLHLACLHPEDHPVAANGNGSCDALVRFLLQAYPDAAMERDRLVRLPLHYAAANEFHHDKNSNKKKKKTPIDVCGTSGTGDDDKNGALRALLDQYPEATTVRDGQGWLPLHVACHYKSKFTTIQALQHVNPDAVVAMTPLDRETPYDLVKKQPDSHDFPDKNEILDFLAEKAKYYVPTPTPFMDSFVSDNFIHPIY